MKKQTINQQIEQILREENARLKAEISALKDKLIEKNDTTLNMDRAFYLFNKDNRLRVEAIKMGITKEQKEKIEFLKSETLALWEVESIAFDPNTHTKIAASALETLKSLDKALERGIEMDKILLLKYANGQIKLYIEE
ncbi:MAG: hypothetical protein JST46_13185 [Bacteroidetes bacterium]|nr:hypothetical protein [Bacteroidota bacterium]